MPSEQKAPMITADELNSVVANHRDGLLFAVLGGTGCCVSEILAIKQQDWDREAGVLFIRAVCP